MGSSSNKRDLKIYYLVLYRKSLAILGVDSSPRIIKQNIKECVTSSAKIA